MLEVLPSILHGLTLYGLVPLSHDSVVTPGLYYLFRTCSHSERYDLILTRTFSYEIFHSSEYVPKGIAHSYSGRFLASFPFFEGVYIPTSVLPSLWELGSDVIYFIINCLSFRPRQQIVVTCTSGISTSILIKLTSTSLCQTSAAVNR